MALLRYNSLVIKSPFEVCHSMAFNVSHGYAINFGTFIPERKEEGERERNINDETE
jgi:hypothetical protein